MEYTQPPAVVIGDQAQLTDAVWHNADNHSSLVQFSASGREITCAEFRDEVAALAAALVAHGIKPGDRIGLMSKTRYEWTLIDYAIWAVGGVTVPIYETSSAEQVRWILSDSGATACFTETPAHTALARETVQDVWEIEGGSLPHGDAASIRRHSGNADDLATIVYTSGTTGRPKGCMLTHRNLLSDVGNAIPAFPQLFYEGSSTLLFLPLAHSFARLLQVAAVEGLVRVRHSSDVKNLVAELAAFKPTFLLAVPRVFEKVYNGAKQRAHADGKGAIFDRAERVAIEYSQARETAKGPSLALRLQHNLFDRLVYGRLRHALGGQCEYAISGGAPLGARLNHFFRGVGLQVFEGYGLTETSPGLTFNRVGGNRVGTVGQPLPGVTIRIDDDGEILAKGEVVFGGYWQNAAATAEALDADGWFHTGDLGALDADGYLTITGRKKEILVTAGGKNVAPAQLEDQIRAHPLVSQCMVIGDRRPFIAALITIDPEALDGPIGDVTTDPRLHAEIQAAVDEANKSVSQAEAIRAFRILPRDFTEETGELTPSLKVKRAVVMKEYASAIEAIYGG